MGRIGGRGHEEGGRREGADREGRGKGKGTRDGGRRVGGSEGPGRGGERDEAAREGGGREGKGGIVPEEAAVQHIAGSGRQPAVPAGLAAVLPVLPACKKEMGQDSASQSSPFPMQQTGLRFDDYLTKRQQRQREALSVELKLTQKLTKTLPQTINIEALTR